MAENKTTTFSNKVEWCLIGKIYNVQFMGKEIMFYGRGCHIIFINMTTEETSFYTANNEKCGDGVSYYAGHRTHDIFCFAENCGNPNIFVLNYPKFEIISILEGGSKEGYISLAFSESSLLLSLGNLPYFTLTAWNWRKGEQLGSSRGQFFRQKQIIGCNTVNPVRVSQLAENTTKLCIWDILICGKKCVMTHHIIKLPQIKPLPLIMTLWSNDGFLYTLDIGGNVHQVNQEYTLEKIISFNSSDILIPSFTLWKGDLVVTGPSKDIRFYRKNGSFWDIYNTMDPPENLQNIKANKNDILVGLTDRAKCIKFDPENKDYTFFNKNEGDFQDICLIYPVGDYICLLSQGNILNAIEVQTGKMVSTYNLMGTATKIASNTEYPYVGIGYINGILELISVYNPLKLDTMIHFNLTTNPISSIYFGELGKVVVAGHLPAGELFVLEGLPGSRFKIIITINTGYPIVDYIMVPSSNCYRLFLIPSTSKDFLGGDKIIRYCILSANKLSIKEYNFPEPNKYYYRIISTSKCNRDRVFYVVSHNLRSIEHVQTKRGDDSIILLRSIDTCHQFRQKKVALDKYHALTWSFDGFIMARTADFDEYLGIILPHHRRNGGVRTAVIDPQGKFIVSLGNSLVLTCTNLINREENKTLQNELLTKLNSKRFHTLFHGVTTGPQMPGGLQDYTWREIYISQKKTQAVQPFNKDKEWMMLEFNEIKRELKRLLEKNLEGPENERLSLVEFNLDVKSFNEMKEANRIECNETEQYIKKYIVALNKVRENIKNLCYNSMHVQKRKIMAISSNVNVESYAILPPDGKKMEHLRWIEEQIKMERFVNENDIFEPWKPMESIFREEFLEKSPIVPMIKKSKRFEDLEGDSDISTYDKETAIAMLGSTAQNFIEVAPEKYNQFECQTFYQLQFLAAMTENDTVRLREYFNKEFEKIMQLKTREILQIKEKNQRLRYIVDEINYFSTDKIFIKIRDPVWSAYENLTMINVDDSQVPIRPYVSPSQQAILNAKAAEAERLRLLLLADDFKERALMAMMNGVLEVRWEDELKKEVPKPKCMLEKEPEEFNEDDLRAIKDYEEKVKFLNSERERYKNLLDQEYSKLSTQLRESVKKFDSRISNLKLLRIKVDEAIIQEILILCKQRVKLLQRIEYGENELTLKKFMVANEKMIRVIEKIIHGVQESVTECRGQVEVIQNRDKTLEKNMRKELSEFNHAAQEAALKLLKRRPKISYKHLNSPTILHAFAKAVMTKERPLSLTDECLEYLDSLDHMDQFTGVPPTVDEEAYSVICKHRRLRIEHEIKLKCATVLVTEAETTASFLQKRLTQKKDQNIKAMAELNQLRTDRLNKMQNMQIQIVLKQGYVEVPMSGNIGDFNDAILISRKEIENINKIILDHGRIKLNSMRHSMSFHRKIMHMEWTHKKLRMHIEDLKEELNDIMIFKVTKEMQGFLKAKEKTLPFEVELDLLKNSYELIVNEKKAAVAKMKRLINGLKDDSKKLDVQINNINVDVCECRLDKDWDLDIEATKLIEERMVSLAKRSKMVKKIQENHQTILLLQTELELLRLKTYPTIKYKILS